MQFSPHKDKNWFSLSNPFIYYTPNYIFVNKYRKLQNHNHKLMVWSIL